MESTQHFVSDFDSHKDQYMTRKKTDQPSIVNTPSSADSLSDECECLTTKDAAAALLRKPQTLHRWASYENGPIRPVRVGRRLAWKRSDVEKLIGGPAFRQQPIQPSHAASRATGNSTSEPTTPGPAAKVGSTDLHLNSVEASASRSDDDPLGLYIDRLMEGSSVYKRGELIVDVCLSAPPYRVERVLVDQDTGARFYILRRVDINRELFRSGEVVENFACYRPLMPLRR